MINSLPKSEPTLLETVDFRAFFETLRVRWWVIPLVLGATIGLLVAQETRLRTEPISYEMTRTYAFPDPKALLNQISINPETVKEIPDPADQLSILRSDQVKREIARQVGAEVDVEVPPTYSLPFVFSCVSPDRAACDSTLDAYAKKQAEIRREAIAAGLVQLREVFSGIQASAADQTAAAKVAGINGLLNSFNTDLVLVDRVESPIGATVSGVSRRKYVFGLAAGSLLSLLILLQLTHIDSRVRSPRQLVRLVGDQHFLGTVSAKVEDVRRRRAAIALLHAMNVSASTRVRYVPLRNAPVEPVVLASLAESAGIGSTIAASFAEMTVSELTQKTPGDADVIVVQRRRDLRRDVVEAVAALLRSGRPFAGVLFLA